MFYHIVYDMKISPDWSMNYFLLSYTLTFPRLTIAWVDIQ